MNVRVLASAQMCSQSCLLTCLHAGNVARMLARRNALTNACIERPGDRGKVNLPSESPNSLSDSGPTVALADAVRREILAASVDTEREVRAWPRTDKHAYWR